MQVSLSFKKIIVMKKLIYVLEDDACIREIIMLALENNSWCIKTFANIQSMREEMLSANPDLYLLDMRLPDGNGLDLASVIASNQHTKNIPIILLSASRENHLPENVIDYVAKPFDINDLQEKIRKYLT